jgi:hypothetical protein
MKPSFPLLTIVLLATLAFPTNGHAEGRKERSGRPVLYNFIARAGEPIDQTIREQYSAKYDVVEIRDRSSFSSPRLTKERFPNPVFDANNVEISGSVRVCVVITADGRVVDPVVVGPANPLLTRPVLEVLKQFRAIAARVNGSPVAVADAYKFTFGPAPRRRIDGW